MVSLRPADAHGAPWGRGADWSDLIGFGNLGKSSVRSDALCSVRSTARSP